MKKSKEIKSYFPHDSNARNSDKLIRLRMRHKSAGYGVFFMILERLREEPEYMSVKDYNMIAFDLREDASLIKSVIEDFGLFVFTEDGKYFYSESFKKRMEFKDDKSKKRSEAGDKSAAKKWGNTDREGLSSSELRSKRLSIAREKGTHTNEEWEELKEFFGECVICGSKERIVKDHIVPIYQGGSDAITNLQPLCNSCNSRKGSDNKDYRAEWCKSHNIEMPGKWLTKNRKWLTSKEKKSKVNNIGDSNESLVCGTSQPHSEHIDYSELVKFFNEETKGVFGTVRTPLSDSRKGMINARIKTYGKKTFADMIRMASQSDFLKGQNKKGWRASFDWLIKPTNFEKVISGNYDNKNSRNDPAITNGAKSREEQTDREILEYAAKAFGKDTFGNK